MRCMTPFSDGLIAGARVLISNVCAWKHTGLLLLVHIPQKMSRTEPASNPGAQSLV